LNPAGTALSHKRPLWLAVLLTSALVPLLHVGVLLVIGALKGTSINGEEIARAMGVLIFIAFPILVIGISLCGFLITALLKKWGRLTGFTLCLAAGLVGTLAPIILTAFTTPFRLANLALGCFIGFVAGVVFVLVAGIPFGRASR
jgi:hypothetical protein